MTMETAGAPAESLAGDAPPATAQAASPAGFASEQSALHGLLSPLKRLFLQEPALGITGAYLLVAMAGIFYLHRFYSRFGIPVLSLSQISDFLVAGIQEPVALLLVLSTLPIIWLFDWINLRMRRRQRKIQARLQALPKPTRWQRWRLRWLRLKLDGSHWPIRLAYLVILFGYGWTFVSLYADHRVELVERGQVREVRVWQGETLLKSSGGETWRYLGAVSNYVFVYDEKAHSAQVLPVNALGRIEPLPRTRSGEMPAAAEKLAPKR